MAIQHPSVRGYIGLLFGSLLKILHLQHSRLKLVHPGAFVLVVFSCTFSLILLCGSISGVGALRHQEEHLLVIFGRWWGLAGGSTRLSQNNWFFGWFYNMVLLFFCCFLGTLGWFVFCLFFGILALFYVFCSVFSGVFNFFCDGNGYRVV